jgi:hypothetical protein
MRRRLLEGAALLSLLLAPAPGAAQADYDVLHAFEDPPYVINELVIGTDGSLYGTSQGAGRWPGVGPHPGR